MSNQLIIGVLLIAAGLLLGVVAYWVISGGGSSKAPEFVGDEDEGEEPEAMGIDKVVQGPLTLDDVDISGEIPVLPADVQAPTEQDDLETIDEIDPGQPPVAILHSKAEVVLPDTGESDMVKSGQPDLPPQAGPRISIATLLRDDVTGKLIVKVGDTEYQNPDELRASSDWTRVEFAATDLQKWISKDAPVQLRAERELEAAEPKPLSMIQQIDAILQEKIASSGRPNLGVRLLESPSGAARVLIGVQSYDLADVPDEDIRQLIQEAVAIWEVDQ